MYDPEKMKEDYDRLEHGKVMMSAIRAAYEEADRQNDVPYQIYFRLELCHESCFYGDGLDMMVVFPEILALSDQHPDAPVTAFDQFLYGDSLDHVLWVYKWVLGNCESFYQIPLEDCLGFFEDAKKRFQSYGYNLKPIYRIQYNFYQHIDKKKAEEAFREYERLPRDYNSDCEACDRNTEIFFYLDKGDLEKAGKLSADIESFKLTCSEKWSAWLRMKKYFMHYYMKRKEYAKALEYAKLMERHLCGESEYERWDDFLACYAYSDLGKALKIYKEHWREWQSWRNPSDEFHFCINACRFFRELLESRKGQEGIGSGEHGAGRGGSGDLDPVIKLPLDNTFPLYQESGEYSIARMYDYYFEKAADLAAKFDARNQADGYRKELEEALCMTR